MYASPSFGIRGFNLQTTEIKLRNKEVVVILIFELVKDHVG
jgi:hypothetical protein